eukprot:scaffold425_cov175-Amphora_coffeaeformis.AAC.79
MFYFDYDVNSNSFPAPSTVNSNDINETASLFLSTTVHRVVLMNNTRGQRARLAFSAFKIRVEQPMVLWILPVLTGEL